LLTKQPTTVNCKAGTKVWMFRRFELRIIKLLTFVPALHAGKFKDFMDCMHEWNQAIHLWRYHFNRLAYVVYQDNDVIVQLN